MSAPLLLCQPPTVRAYVDGDEVGSLTWFESGEVAWVHVTPALRRQGVASAMLAKARRYTGEDIFIDPSNASDDGGRLAAALSARAFDGAAS